MSTDSINLSRKLSRLKESARNLHEIAQNLAWHLAISVLYVVHTFTSFF